jgi:hypothetical protein
MLTQRQRRQLQQAIARLEQACECVQDALGESDATQFTNMAIQDIIAELEQDLVDN